MLSCKELTERLRTSARKLGDEQAPCNRFFLKRRRKWSRQRNGKGFEQEQSVLRGTLLGT